MAVGIVRKEPTYRFMSCYDPVLRLCTLATLLLEVVFRSAYDGSCCFAVLQISGLKLFRL
jgi:hypothetical protein